MLAESRWMVDARRRRLILMAVAVVLLILTFFPRQYRAAASLAPQNANTTGIGGVVGSVGGAYTSFMANYLPVEIDLAVARSIEVRRDVYKRLNLSQRWGYGSEQRALSRLENKVDIRALRANILEISTKDHDPDFALALVRTFTIATQRRLAELSREQTAYKRSILDNRVNFAAGRLAEAQSKFNNFRREHRMADPGDQLGLAAERLKLLQKSINDKEVELATTRQFQTNENMKVKALMGEIAALQRQLAQVQNIAQPANSQTVEGVVQQQTEFELLNRQLTYAKGLFEAYTRSLEGTSVEQLTADFNMRFLDDPYLDPDIQVNLLPMSLLLLVVALGLAVEFYLMRPPVGALRGFEAA